MKLGSVGQSLNGSPGSLEAPAIARSNWTGRLASVTAFAKLSFAGGPGLNVAHSTTSSPVLKTYGLADVVVGSEAARSRFHPEKTQPGRAFAVSVTSLPVS